MKTSIIYSGALRSFEKCWANHRWFIHRHFPEARFFFVFEDDEDAHKISVAEKALAPFRVDYRKVKQPEMTIPPGCPNEWTPGKPYMHEPYHISVDPRAVLGQLWMLREGWRLYREANDPADLVIRCRPDLWFHSFEVPKFVRIWMNPKAISDTDGNIAFTPRFGKFGGCNDRFGLLGWKAAQSYFEAFDSIPAMIAEGAPLHPETLVNYAMTRNGATVFRDMVADFSTLRKNGEMRAPEITGTDLLDAAMR